MTAVVVFNPTNIPVSDNGILVGSGEWVFVNDVSKVSNLLANGKLVISSAPDDPTRINVRAQKAFEELRDYQARVARENDTQQSTRKSRNNKSQSTTDNTEGD